MKTLFLNILDERRYEFESFWFSKLPQNIIKKYIDQDIKTFIYEIIEALKDLLTNKNNIQKFPSLSKLKFEDTDFIKVLSIGKLSLIELVEEEKINELKIYDIYSFTEELFSEIILEYYKIKSDEKIKTVSAERDKLQKQLEINQQYLQNILHYSDLAIMVVDNNEEFIAWNRGAEKIFGYSQKEVIGKKSSFLLPEGEKYKTELKRIIEEVNLRDFSKIIETERKTKDNNIIPVQLNVAKLPGENNEFAGRTIVITDVTEVRKLQQQVDQSEKLAVIGQLAAGVAHEIGNPLASISSIVQILQRKSKDQFTSDQLLNVKDNINRISKIVRELVDLSRPPSHDELVTQIKEVIKTAVGIVKHDKRVKKVEFKTDLTENMPMVKIVPDQLLQVFINILINSLDAIDGEGTIKVKSSFDDKFIYVNIIDNGCGIEEDAMKKIFDPFFTTKQVGKGTGLGLSVSYGIIKKFNGDIKVKSKVGEGSDFQVQIPITKHN